jgi:hypothetical protein
MDVVNCANIHVNRSRISVKWKPENHKFSLEGDIVLDTVLSTVALAREKRPQKVENAKLASKCTWLDGLTR